MHQPPDALWDFLLLYYHFHPVDNDGTHNDMKNRGQEGVSLRQYVEPLEGRGYGILQPFPQW